MRYFMGKKATRLLSLFLLAVLVLSCCGCIQKAKKTVDSEGIVRDLTWALGTAMPQAVDFRGPAFPSDGEIEFTSSDPFSDAEEGENTVRLRVRTEGSTTVWQATLTLVIDKTGPSIKPGAPVIGYTQQAGRGISYWKDVTLTDDCDGAIARSVSTADVDFTKAGIYPIWYIATDAAGNKTVVGSEIHIFAQEITLEMLNEKLDPIIESLGLYGIGKLEQCRGIYDYVHLDKTVHYVGSSNESDRVSWIREAYFTLKSKSGDCYSYFSLAKAFLERLGIESLDVQRTPGLTEDTHYWLMVDLGDETSGERWYHFDCTRLKETIYTGGILTDAQVRYYSENCKINFYAYDRSAYPATPKEEVCTRK